MNRLIWLVVACALGCSTPANSNNDNNTDDDSGNPNNVNNMSDGGQNNVNNVEACEPLQEEFKSAVRALPRDCGSDAECVLALRSGPCDCAIAVNSGSDLPRFDTARESLDNNECRNPFVCIGDRCEQYRLLSDPGELIPKCTGNECEVVQLMSCTDYENNKNGGIISESSCVTDADCTLRTDLNPCNCQEAVSTSFPLLAGQTIRELIGLNTDRCNTVCEGCPVINGVSCVDEGDVKRCRTN